MNIFKAKSDTIQLWDLYQWINNHPDAYKTRMGISWKIGKRRKLRSYSISWIKWECDCCGPITSVELTKGTKSFTLSFHFGPGSMHMSELEAPQN
jgi:hypothetical protein